MCSPTTIDRSASALSLPVALQPITSTATTRIEEKSSLDSLESEFHIDPHILRGVQIHKSMRRFGALWSKSPLDLDETKRANLYTQSEQRAHLDYFISHAWATPGWAKHLSLTFFAMWKVILLSMWATTILIFLVLLKYGLPWDPSPDEFFAQVQCWQGYVVAHPGFSVFLGVPIYASLIMFSSTASQFPALGYGGRWAFLDLVCISQTDKHLQFKGVKSLAGFISKSNEFILLWSAPYFSRKWCVYEVAAFMKSHSHDQIIFQPVFMGSSAIVGAAISLSGAVMWVVTTSILREGRDSVIFLAIYVSVIGWGTNCLRRCLQLHQIMQEQLEKFDVRQALCREPTDSDYIDRAIEHWYGGIAAFNKFVRTHLRVHLLGKASAVHFSYFFCLVVNPFEPLIRITYTAAYIRVGVSLDSAMSLFIEILCAVFFNGPLCVISMYVLATQLATRIKSPRCATALSLLAGFVIVVAWVTLTEIGVRARNFHIAASVILAAVEAGVTWLVFRCLLPLYQSAHAEIGPTQERYLPHVPMEPTEQPLDGPATLHVVPSAVGLSSNDVWFTPVYHI